MQIFLDTADFIEIKDRYETGLISGITTNPTLVRKSGVSYFDFISLLSKEFSFESISAEVNGNTASEMIENAEQYISIGSEITIKLPLTREGLIACKDLSDQEIKTNVTLCFSVAQAAMASMAGATYISPFAGEKSLILPSQIRLRYMGMNLAPGTSNVKNSVSSRRVDSDMPSSIR